MNFFRSIIDERDMIKYIRLPDFLVTLEEFNKIQDPPLRNLKRNEVSKAQGQQNIGRLGSENDDIQKRKRRFKEYCCGPREFMSWILLSDTSTQL